MAKKKKITPEELLDIFKGYIPEVKRQIAKKMPGLITEQTRNSDGIWNTTWQCGICGCENFSNQHLTRYSTYEETCEHCGAVSCHYEYKNHCEEHLPVLSNNFNVVVETDDDTYCYFGGICTLSYKPKEKPSWEVGDCVLEYMAKICNMLKKSSDTPSVIQYRSVSTPGKPVEWKPTSALVPLSFDIKEPNASLWDVSNPEKFSLEELLTKTTSFQRETKDVKATEAERTRAKKLADEIASIPELHEPFPCPDAKDYLGILTKAIETDTVSNTYSVRAKCLECGHEWLYEQSSRPIPVECPYCGNIRKKPDFPSLGESRKSSFTAYISADDDKIKIRVSRILWDGNNLETKLRSEPEYYYEISKDKKPRRYQFCGKWERKTSKDEWYNTIDVSFIDGADKAEIIKYSGLLEYIKAEPYMRLPQLVSFLDDSLKYPIVEKLVKGGFIEEYKKLFLYCKPTEKNAMTICEFFGLPKGLLKAYTETRKLDLDWTPNIENLSHLYSSFPDASVDDLIWCFIYGLSPSYINNIIEAVPHLSLHNIVTYLERVRLGQFFEPRAAAIEWRDYLHICVSIDMDMHDRRVLYPRALKTEHDIALSKRIFVNDAKTKKAFSEAVECYKELEYSKGDYFIKVPTDTASMLEEGRKLKHCCGRYVDDVAKKKAFVLFLRKKESPETPYLSIEVLPDRRVRQVRGLNDTYVSALPEYKDVNLFLTYWAKAKKLKLDIV